jgi:hypothetical protein
MPVSVRVDPSTGLKIFDTRAAKSTVRIEGTGYSVITDSSMAAIRDMAACFDASADSLSGR